MLNSSISANLTTPTTQQNPTSLSKEEDITLKVLYVFVSGLGLFGSSFVIYLFAAKKVKRTPFNMLLLNLVISDAIADLSILPYVFLDLKRLRGMSKTITNIICTLTEGQAIFWISITSSTLTLTAISISRFLFIRHPLKARFFNSKHASWIIIGFIWPYSIGIMIPNLISLDFDAKHAICKRVWPPNFSGTIYSIALTLTGFMIPVFIMCFTFIATKRYFSNVDAQGISCSERAVNRRRKAAVLLWALIVAFFVCSTPYTIYWILSRSVKYFSDGIKGEYARNRAERFVLLFSLSNTVADPIIYGIRGEDFKRSVQTILSCFSSPVQKRVNAQTNRTSRKENDIPLE